MAIVGAIGIIGEGKVVIIGNFMIGTSTLPPFKLSIIIIVCVLELGVLDVFGKIGG